MHAIDDAHLETVLAQVRRFASSGIERRVSRPEVPLARGELHAILGEASALGLDGPDADGVGLWDDLGDDGRRSLAILEQIGRANAGCAWALHQRALGRAIGRCVGLEGDALALPFGRFGIGRDVLARHLGRTPLSDDDQALLGDVYARGAPRIVACDDAFPAVVSPFWDGRSMQWQRHPREMLIVSEQPHAHGLDELVTCEISPAHDAADVTALDDALAREIFARALAATQLAIVSISLGAVDRARAKARAFAAQRRQGGAIIDRHAAVQLLLGRAELALRSVRAELSAAPKGDGVDALVAAAALRAHAQPALADAANDALQVFGGLGYMRDTGLEEIVRDVSHLRTIAGTPRELTVLVAEWERLHV